MYSAWCGAQTHTRTKSYALVLAYPVMYPGYPEVWCVFEEDGHTVAVAYVCQWAEAGWEQAAGGHVKARGAVLFSPV